MAKYCNGESISQPSHNNLPQRRQHEGNEVPATGNLDSLFPCTHQNIQSSTSNYQEVALIGSGAYGTVYKARSCNSESFVALKKMRIPLNQEGVPNTLVREIALLKQLETFNHPNIVKLLDVCNGNRSVHDRHFTLYLVFEHVDQDLATYLERCPSPGLGPDRIRDIMYQVMQGVDFLHTNRIVHRDLKPQNILVSSNGNVKIADFGLARIYEQMNTLTTVVVTLWYRAPEILLKSSYASPVDIWSCACILAELFLRGPLFPGQSEFDQLTKIFEVIGSPLEEEWPPEVSLSWRTFESMSPPLPLSRLIPELDRDAEDLLLKTLVFDCNKRLNASQILQHPYFGEYQEFSPMYATPSSSQESSSSRSSLGSTTHSCKNNHVNGWAR